MGTMPKPAEEKGDLVLLVTGATGNVGAELVRALAVAGEPVRALSRSGTTDGLPLGAEAVAGAHRRVLNPKRALRTADGRGTTSGCARCVRA